MGVETDFGRAEGVTGNRNKPSYSQIGYAEGYIFPYIDAKKRGITDMSLCLMVFTDKTAYVGIDSRSVNNVPNHANKYDIVNDNTQKYYFIDDNTVVFTTGQNTFGRDNISFVDIMKTIECSNLPLDKLLNILNRAFYYRVDDDKEMYMYVFRWHSDGILMGDLRVRWEGKIIEYAVYPEGNIYTFVISGALWAKSIVEETPFNEPVKFIERAFMNVYDARDPIKNTVGGPIHILKIGNDGFKWERKDLIIDS